MWTMQRALWYISHFCFQCEETMYTELPAPGRGSDCGNAPTMLN